MIAVSKVLLFCFCLIYLFKKDKIKENKIIPMSKEERDNIFKNKTFNIDVHNEQIYDEAPNLNRMYQDVFLVKSSKYFQLRIHTNETCSS